MVRYLFFLIFWILSPSQTLAESLLLNGSAPYAYLNQEYYVVGLYLPQHSSDPLYIFSDKTPKKARLVISANRWSVRMWARDWQDNFSINNSAAGLGERAKTALEDFISLPRDDLLRGDEVLLEYTPVAGTTLRFNGDIVFVDQGAALMNSFLALWIGDLPPSREFRQRLLAGDGAGNELLDSNNRAAERQHIYAQWLRQDEEKKLAQEAEAARLLAESTLRRHQAEQLRLAELRAAQERQIAMQQAEKEQAAARARAVKSDVVLLDPAPVAVPVVLKEKPPAVLANEQYYFLQLLRWKINKIFLEEINPDVGVLSRAGGLVRCEFYVDRQGKVVRMAVDDSNVKKFFIDEVQRAIGVAAAKVKVPDELEGRKWQINMEYDFALDRTAQRVVVMPRRPESLAVSE